MIREFIYFWEESSGKQSSKRLIQLCLTGFAIIISSIYLIFTWDYVGFVAIFASIMAVVTSMMGIGKKQENDRERIKAFANKQ